MTPEYDLQPLLEARQNQLNLVFSDGDSIDTKALALLATNVAILLFIAQVGLRLTSWWQHGLLIVPFFISLIFNGFAVWPRKYIGTSGNPDTYPKYLNMDKETLLLQLLADTQFAINTNSLINALRWRYCFGSLLMTVLGTIILFVIL